MSELEHMAATALAQPVGQPAIEFARQWINWGDMRHVAERVGELIDASGARPGARIALIARNRPSAIAAFLGLLAKRHCVRMVYPFQSATALAREIDTIGPAAVVAAEADFTGEVVEVLQAKSIAAVALRDMDALPAPGCERSRIAASATGEPLIEILTSGTTGKPKPFTLSYDMVARHIVGANIISYGGDDDPAQQPPILLYFPVGNISGLYSTLPPLLSGRRAVLLDRFTLEEWHDHLLRFRPSVGGLPPAGVQMVLDANLPREDLACLRAFGVGAAPLDPAVQKAFEERYGIPILLSYGATEFAGPVTRMTPELHAGWGDKKLGSVGQPLPGMQLRIVDPTTGTSLPAGQEGILEVICPRVGSDWIRTSDICVIDEDGFLFHRGRADGAIVRGGFKILPETIERALLLHPAVSSAAVVGIADERLGQVPAAAVVLKPHSAEVSSQALETHLRQHILATHIPTAWKFVAELPRTKLSFKVDQTAVRQLFAP